MSTQVIESQSSNAMNEMLADIILDGNIKNLNRDQKKNYVMKVCEVTGLNPALRPFDFITLQGREVMYANKQAAEQLRQIHNILESYLYYYIQLIFSSFPSPFLNHNHCYLFLPYS